MAPGVTRVPCARRLRSTLASSSSSYTREREPSSSFVHCLLIPRTVHHSSGGQRTRGASCRGERRRRDSLAIECSICNERHSRRDLHEPREQSACSTSASESHTSRLTCGDSPTPAMCTPSDVCIASPVRIETTSWSVSKVTSSAPRRRQCRWRDARGTR